MQNRSQNNVQGIDVSHHNGKINWSQVAADGRKFVFVKASEGQKYRDAQFKTNVMGARAAGLLVSAYHFVRATNAAEAKTEAQNFAGAIASAGGIDLFDLPPVMDYENTPASLGRSATIINTVAKTFLDELQRLTGRQPMIYTGNSFGQVFAKELGAYPLWIARYSSKVPDDMPAWKQWTIWQYSETGKVPGINSNVDLNEFNGTYDELKSFCTREDGEDVEKIAELQQIIKGQGERIAKLEQIVNVSGNQIPPEWAHDAIAAAKASGAITTSNDKSRDALIMIQMLYNIGLLKGGNK